MSGDHLWPVVLLVALVLFGVVRVVVGLIESAPAQTREAVE